MQLQAIVESQVDDFATQACQDQSSRPIFELKEEVKQYQQLAKGLSFSTKGFHKIREKLGVIWEELKKIEKRRKLQKKELNEKAELIEGKLDNLSNIKNDPKQMQGIFKSMEKSLKKTNLLKEDRQRLKKKLEQIEEPLLAGQKEFNEMKKKIDETKVDVDQLPAQISSYEEQISLLNNIVFNPMELDLALDRFISRSLEQNSATGEVHRFIKDRFENLRKSRAKSNLDFEQSFLLTQRVDVLKKSLESMK